MKKVRCPRCGVINLEKFVTFPYCAGCGALLPPVPETTLPLWRRPLKPLFWVTTVGCAAAALLAATMSFKSAPPEPGHIIIYGLIPHYTTVGRQITLRLTVDTIESPTAHDQVLNNVRLRLAGQWLKKFKMIAIDPSPDDTTVGGSARYFHFQSLTRNTPLKLTVQALQPGHHRLKAVIYADQQYPGEYRSSITVAPQRAKKINRQ